MRRVAGIGLFVLGLFGMLLGGGAAVVLGPDDQVTTGPHQIDTDVRAVVTRPAVLARYGPQVSIIAEVPDDKPVLIGVANTVDLDDYLASTARVEITGYQIPWDLEQRTVDGDPQLPAAPTAVDWWRESTASHGGGHLRFRLPEETVSLAVLAVGDADLSGLQISASYEVPGGFGAAVGTALTSLGVFLVGLVLLRLVPGSRRRTPAWNVPALADDEWDTPWPETDPADLDAWDDFLAESDAPQGDAGEEERSRPGAIARIRTRAKARADLRAERRRRNKLVGAGARARADKTGAADDEERDS